MDYEKQNARVALWIWEWHLENIDGGTTGADALKLYRDQCGAHEARERVLEAAPVVAAIMERLIARQDQDDSFIGSSDWDICPAICARLVSWHRIELDETGLYEELKTAQDQSAYETPDALPLGAWTIKAESVLRERYGIGLRDAGLSDSDISHHFDGGLSPVDWVEWYGVKYDLTLIESK